MEYILKIKSIKYVDSLDGYKNVIISIDWEYSYDTFTMSGTLDVPSPSYDNFIPIEAIEEAQLNEWVYKIANLNEYHKDIQAVINTNDNVEIKTINYEN